MRFTLIDRITRLEPGRRISAIKTVSMAEEYLGDHFPRFPVLPGVLMLEAMTQTSAWLIRASEDFRHSVVVLKEARNVKYANFVSPGRMLTIDAEIEDHDERMTRLEVKGRTDGKINVSGRLYLERYNLVAGDSSMSPADAKLIREMRQQFGILYRGDEAPVEELASPVQGPI